MTTFFSELVPFFVRRLLYIGNEPYEFKGLDDDGLEEVWFEENPLILTNQFSDNYFDCIFINRLFDQQNRLIPALRKLSPYLNPIGVISVQLSSPMESDHFIDTLDESLNELGFLRYKLLAEEPENQKEQLHGFVFVRSDYNPILHARGQAEKGDFYGGIQILNGIPHDLIQNEKNLSLISAEKQRLYFKWQRSLPPDAPRHMLFFRARKEFADVTSTLPHKHEAYQTEAEFWHHIGNDNMAVRTLRSVLGADYDRKTEAMLSQFDPKAACATAASNPAPWSGTKRLPRLLVITHDFSDYGMDTLYDGLCRVLGNENVIEFPWKPILHGCNSEEAQNYPCAFNYRTRQHTLDEILQGLEHNYFDLIVYADVVQMAYPEEIRRILKTGLNLPVVLYDPYDNCYTPWKKIFDYIERDGFALYFKREMLTCVDYGANAFALPFSYPEGLIDDGLNPVRSHDVFWAGKSVWGLRPIYIPKVEQILDQKFDQSFSQAEYRKQLQTSRIGLSFFGSGFDTVRYWEIPANGAMLLAERPPIKIPYNFIDDQSAVFFEDIAELEDKLRYYLRHPRQAAEIANAGYEHLKRYHTSTARARQFLGYLERYLAW